MVEDGERELLDGLPWVPKRLDGGRGAEGDVVDDVVERAVGHWVRDGTVLGGEREDVGDDGSAIGSGVELCSERPPSNPIDLCGHLPLPAEPGELALDDLEALLGPDGDGHLEEGDTRTG